MREGVQGDEIVKLIEEEPNISVLVLGAGLIAAPGVRYLAEAGFRVILGSRTLAKAQAMVAGLEHAEAPTRTGTDEQEPAAFTQ